MPEIGAVATSKGLGRLLPKVRKIYQQGAYPADYSIAKVGRSSSTSISFDFFGQVLSLEVLFRVHLSSFRECLTNTCINYVRKDLRHCLILHLILRDSGRVHLLGQFSVSLENIYHVR